MGSQALRNRINWQTSGGIRAALSEAVFFDIFRNFFADSEFEIISRPAEFKKVYVDYPISNEDRRNIYCPPKPITIHGFVPDYAIVNNETGKKIYVEVKQQDGWVAGKARKAGRGNAHERLCKYFTPGLMKILRDGSNLHDETILPFWIVFQGDITRDPCRVREINCWFDGFSDHFYFWRDTSNADCLLHHFSFQLAHHLD